MMRKITSTNVDGKAETGTQGEGVPGAERRQESRFQKPDSRLLTFRPILSVSRFWG